MSSAPLQQILDVDAESIREPLQHHDRGIPPPALEARQISLMDIGAMSELLLRVAARPPQALQIEAESDPHIHGRMARSGLTLAHRL